MYDRDTQSQPGGGATAFAALLVGAALGAVTLLLATEPGKRLLAQFGDRTEDWKAQAAAAIAEAREKVVTSVEAEAPPPPPPGDYGQQVRKNL